MNRLPNALEKSITPTTATSSPTRRGVLLSAAGGAGALLLAACGTQAAGTAGESSPRLGPKGFTIKQPVAITYWK
jgi:hypothetical protein